MSNPYEILNIQKGATKDEVRRAYKKLAKQYHPDQYDNNPLRDLAEERMVEINEAYESLMKTFDNKSSSSNTSSSSRTYTNNSSSSYNQNRSSSYNGNYGQRQNNSYNNGNQNSNYGGGNYNNASYNSTYESIRSDIYSGNLRGAEHKLNALKTKDAEWNYLMGILYSKKGWNDSAKRYLSTAVRMNPNHVEYRNAMEQANFQTTPYRQNYYGRRHGNNDMFDLCFKLWCADSLCECAGGDLIDCM